MTTVAHMNKNNPAELVKSWSSVAGHSNVLVVTGSNAPYLNPILALDEEHRAALGITTSNSRTGSSKSEKPFEVVHVETPADAMRLLMRAHLAVVVLDGSPLEPGFVDFLVAGLNKPEPPRFVILMDGEPSGLDTQGGIRLISRDLPGFRVCEQVIRAAQDFEKGKSDVFAVDFLRAVSGFPDEYWLRITTVDGAQGADFCIKSGRAVYCEVGKLSGDAGAQHLFSWGASRFELREFPAFLRGNMDSRLADLLLMSGRNGVGAVARESVMPSREAAKEEPRKPTRNVWAMPAVSSEPQVEVAPAPQPVAKLPRVTQLRPPDPAAPAVMPPSAEPEIEEPMEIPALAALMQEMEKAEVPSFSMSAEMDEPQEPFFDPTVPEPDIQVEEPPDLYFAETPVVAVDEPCMPDFDLESGAEPAVEEGLRSEVFAAFAVIQLSKWTADTVFPEDASFDWKGLEDLFLFASDGSDRNGLGPLRRVMLMGEGHALVASQVRGVDRVLVARTRDRYFGELEESELMRLLEAVAVTAPV